MSIQVKTGNMLDVIVEGKSIGLKQRDSDHRKHEVIWLPEPEGLRDVLTAEINRLNPRSPTGKVSELVSAGVAPTVDQFKKEAIALCLSVGISDNATNVKQARQYLADLFSGNPPTGIRQIILGAAASLAAKPDEAHRCPRCGRRMQSDFDPDVGMWYECHECDYREAVSNVTPAAKPSGAARDAEALVKEWIETLQDDSRVTDEDAEDLMFRIIAFKPAVVTEEAETKNSV